MIWGPVSEYAIKSGSWTIAKYITVGKSVYGLWFKSENKGYFATAELAKVKAEECESQKNSRV